MFNISNYLKKFSVNIDSEESNRLKMLDIIKKHTQIGLGLESLEVKNYIIHIKSSPAVLNKIFIYKNKILEDINETLPNLKIGGIK